MSPQRGLLKFASRAILAVGLAAATLVLIAGAMAATPAKLTLALFYAAEIVVGAVFIAGVLHLLVSIDERLEQLVHQSGGQ